MKSIILLFSLFCFACSCNNNHQKAGGKFEKIKWQVKKDNDYPYRRDMLDDLVQNYTLKGTKKTALIDLLGQPDRTDSNYLFYRISQNRIGFFPLSTKTLVIKLAGDSTVEWRKIHG